MAAWAGNTQIGSRSTRHAAELRILSPPLQLSDLGISMIWSTLLTPDAGHTWLRKQVAALARELESTAVLDQAM